MSFPATIAQATLDTVIGRLALLFLTGACGDMVAARYAASQMLAAYNAETPDELGLAAEIVSLQMHTLEALSDASDPELSLNKVLRLRGGAVSLSRESHKARRTLDQLQRARRAGVTAQPAEVQSEAAQPQPAQPQPVPAEPKIDNALSLIEVAREAIQTAQKSSGQNWSQSLQKRMTAKRITDTLKKKQAEHAALAAHSNTTAARIHTPDAAVA
jgi:hypothetical protein